MEKKKYELCLEVLKRFSSAGVLNSLIIIGSWCTLFYKEYFSGVKYLPIVKTRDIDFLVPIPVKLDQKVDVPELLKDLGFVVGFKGSKGYIKLEHPDLIVEFLIPEKGRGSDAPYPLPQLGLNAQALRFLNFLTQNTIRVDFEGISIILPHPANYSLHKIIIFQRRHNPEKMMKDRDSAIQILNALIDKGESSIIKNVYNSIPIKWQKKILNGLREDDDKRILEVIR